MEKKYKHSFNKSQNDTFPPHDPPLRHTETTKPTERNQQNKTVGGAIQDNDNYYYYFFNGKKEATNKRQQP